MFVYFIYLIFTCTALHTQYFFHRWNSKLTMLQSIRDAYADLQQVLGQRGELHLLYGIKADLLNDLINLPEPFDQAT